MFFDYWTCWLVKCEPRLSRQTIIKDSFVPCRSVEGFAAEGPYECCRYESGRVGRVMSLAPVVSRQCCGLLRFVVIGAQQSSRMRIRGGEQAK